MVGAFAGSPACSFCFRITSLPRVLLVQSVLSRVVLHFLHFALLSSALITSTRFSLPCVITCMFACLLIRIRHPARYIQTPMNSCAWPSILIPSHVYTVVCLVDCPMRQLGFNVTHHLAYWQQPSHQIPLSRSLASQQARSLAGEAQAASFPPQPNSSRQCCLIWLFALAPSALPSPGAMPNPGCDAQPLAALQGRLLVLLSPSALHLWADTRVTLPLHSAAAEEFFCQELDSCQS